MNNARDHILTEFALKRHVPYFLQSCSEMICQSPSMMKHSSWHVSFSCDWHSEAPLGVGVTNVDEVKNS